MTGIGWDHEPPDRGELGMAIGAMLFVVMVLLGIIAWGLIL